MTSEVDLCNEALSSISARSTIASLAEASNEAIQCSIHYAAMRDRILRSANWDFASKVATLSLLKALPGTLENTSAPTTVWDASQPTPPWLYSYAYPSDCMRAVRVRVQPGSSNLTGVPIFSVSMPGPAFNSNSVLQFKIGQEQDTDGNQIKVILTNVSQALLQYTGLITSPDLYDPLFKGALVAALAAKLAVALVNDRAMSQDKAREANAAIAQARAAGGNEGPSVMKHVPDWIQARGWSTAQAPYYVGGGEPYASLFIV